MQLYRFLLATTLTIGCAAEPATDDGLDIQLSDSSASGTYSGKSGEVVFRATEVAPQEFDFVLELNGVAITAIVDRNTGVLQYDGYTAADGSDTAMTDEDRALLLDFARALDSYGKDAPAPISLVRGFANTWAEFPSTKELQFVTFAEADRDYTSICSAVNTYQQTTHDGTGESTWEDRSTLEYSYLSMHPAAPAADGTYFWKNGSWQNYEPDHDTSVEYAYGNCFGRCGAGCGSGTQFTWDCADHDNCVRTGHALASFWCDDEFASTTDDWAAAPNCL